ncbi:MAG: hypothetical protein NXI20_28245 [bacterium]|nr:hypothetical protein [bacterium]
MKEKLKIWFSAFLKRKMTKWVLINFPFQVTTKVHHYDTIFIKKGKIREWRTYDSLGSRVDIKH